MSDGLVSEGRALLAQATEGPWIEYDTSMMHIALTWPNNVRVLATMTDIDLPAGVRSSANRRLIVWLRNNAETLLDAVDEVERLRHEITGWEVGARFVRQERDTARDQAESWRGIAARHEADHALAHDCRRKAEAERDEARAAARAEVARLREAIEAVLALCDADAEASLRPTHPDFEPVEVPWTVAIRATFAAALSGSQEDE